MDRFLELLTNINDFMWTYFLIGLVMVTGIYFTFSTKFVQFTYIKEMFKLISEKPKVGKDGEQKGVSAFQAFTISAASRVGTGTIAGVAIAIALGGPGSVFWMWVVALFGGASSFAESTLAQVYKVRDRKGVYRGGPAYYMEKGLGQKWMGVLFAIVISITYGIAFNSVQTNTIAQSLEIYNINSKVLEEIISINESADYPVKEYKDGRSNNLSIVLRKMINSKSELAYTILTSDRVFNIPDYVKEAFEWKMCLIDL